MNIGFRACRSIKFHFRYNAIYYSCLGFPNPVKRLYFHVCRRQFAVLVSYHLCLPGHLYPVLDMYGFQRSRRMDLAQDRCS